MKSFSSLAIRVAVAVPGIGLFAAVAFLDIPYLTTAFFALIAALCATEAVTLFRPGSSMSMKTVYAAMVAGSTVAVALLDPAISIVVILLPGAITGAVWIFSDGITNARMKTAGITGMSVALALGFGLLARLRLDFQSPWIMFVPLLICWLGDSLAYFAGSAFGRHKMAPSISPAKSWEGFFAGIAGAIGGAVLAGSVGAGFPLFTMLMIGAAGGIAAVIGDLLESALKRDAGIKDSGSFLPGHGGFLDRFDSILAVVPVVWALLFIFAFTGVLI
ncbi:MAG: phosphatidate cytidylyltransferase [Candidatus Aegiribacteria sp.]|nr:phosphatidate cytidylyltransferase [Candidatus Aegiribacteria sp.]